MYKYCFIAIIQVKYCMKFYDPKCRKKKILLTLRLYYDVIILHYIGNIIFYIIIYRYVVYNLTFTSIPNQ